MQALLRALEVADADRFALRTFRFYRKTGVVSPPVGLTNTARFGRRQVLEAVCARLAVQLEVATLREATQYTGQDEAALVARLEDLVARRAATAPAPTVDGVPSPAAPSPAAVVVPEQNAPATAAPESASVPTPPPGSQDVVRPPEARPRATSVPATLIPLPHRAVLVLPEVGVALDTPEAIEAFARTTADAIRRALHRP